MPASLATILYVDGLIDEAARAAAEQHDGHSPAQMLIDNKHVDESKLVERLAQRVGLTFIDLEDIEPDPSVAVTIKEPMARSHVALPVRELDSGILQVAMADPSDVFALDDLRNVTGREIEAVVAAPSEILRAIDKLHQADDGMEELAELDDGEEETNLAELEAATEDAPIVKFVNAIISRAVTDGASDIHIEPTETDLRVRYRVDGVLHQVMQSPKNIQSGVISRLKIMADLDIAERRIPQDGRISLQLGGKLIDLRVSTLPAIHGEKVVMRILDRSSVLLSLDDLGFMPSNFAKFEESYRKPYGMILVTGPTGSGKSTTLYATLNILNQPEVNITTTEDPVEYRLDGINQVQIQKKVGMTFAAALRSILRQDPDIVLVGETRDKETAQIAIEAALTGHLVLTTLHTNDAPSSVTRLIEMGIEPFLVGSSIDAVVAQRLARRLCKDCKEPYHADPNVMQQAGFTEEEIDDQPTIYRPAGCSKCGNTGYKGRLAIHEVMVVDEGIERLCVERASSEEIKRFAIKEQGLRVLRRDGLDKVLIGNTSIAEVGRVVV